MEHPKFYLIVEKLTEIFDEEDIMPDDVLNSMNDAWQNHCEDRKRRGYSQIDRMRHISSEVKV